MKRSDDFLLVALAIAGIITLVLPESKLEIIRATLVSFVEVFIR